MFRGAVWCSLFCLLFGEWVELPKLSPEEYLPVPEVNSEPQNTEKRLVSVQLIPSNRDPQVKLVTTVKTPETKSQPPAPTTLVDEQVTETTTQQPQSSESSEEDECAESSDCTEPDSGPPIDDNNLLSPQLLAVLMDVHKTLAQTANQPLPVKLKFLSNLHNEFLMYIKRQSRGLWTDVHHGQSRGYGLLSFSSLEGALITISFLTFAVFLIKIVQQFIQGLQGTNTIGIQVPGAITPAGVIRHRREEEVKQEEDAVRILKYIEQFHTKVDDANSKS